MELTKYGRAHALMKFATGIGGQSIGILNVMVGQFTDWSGTVRFDPSGMSADAIRASSITNIDTTASVVDMRVVRPKAPGEADLDTDVIYKSTRYAQVLSKASITDANISSIVSANSYLLYINVTLKMSTGSETFRQFGFTTASGAETEEVARGKVAVYQNIPVQTISNIGDGVQFSVILAF